MLCAALENYRELKGRNEAHNFNFQNIGGVLHFGLTPIFFKVHIKDDYMANFSKKIKMEEIEMPELTIVQYAPIEPYMDQELLMKSSRSILFKCYINFIKLLQSYDNEKLLSIDP